MLLSYSMHKKHTFGSSDLTAGAIVGSSEFIKKLKDVNSGMAMLWVPLWIPEWLTSFT
jgi:hypothetical protein